VPNKWALHFRFCLYRGLETAFYPCYFACSLSGLKDVPVVDPFLSPPPNLVASLLNPLYSTFEAHQMYALHLTDNPVLPLQSGAHIFRSPDEKALTDSWIVL
jgi:hypothetical protein